MVPVSNPGLSLALGIPPCRSQLSVALSKVQEKQLGVSSHFLQHASELRSVEDPTLKPPERDLPVSVGHGNSKGTSSGTGAPPTTPLSKSPPPSTRSGTSDLRAHFPVLRCRFHDLHLSLDRHSIQHCSADGESNISKVDVPGLRRSTSIASEQGTMLEFPAPASGDAGETWELTHKQTESKSTSSCPITVARLPMTPKAS